MFIHVYFALKLVVKREGWSCMVVYTAICRTMSKSAKTAFIVRISWKKGTIWCVHVYRIEKPIPNFFGTNMCTFKPLVNTHLSSFWSSNLIGWEEWDILVILVLKTFQHSHHSVCVISHSKCHSGHPNTVFLLRNVVLRSLLIKITSIWKFALTFFKFYFLTFYSSNKT